MQNSNIIVNIMHMLTVKFCFLNRSTSYVLQAFLFHFVSFLICSNASNAVMQAMHANVLREKGGEKEEELKKMHKEKKKEEEEEAI